MAAKLRVVQKVSTQGRLTNWAEIVGERIWEISRHKPAKKKKAIPRGDRIEIVEKHTRRRNSRGNPKVKSNRRRNKPAKGAIMRITKQSV